MLVSIETVVMNNVFWKTGVILGFLSVSLACSKNEDKGIDGMIKTVVIEGQSEEKDFVDSYTFFYNSEKQLSQIYYKYLPDKEDTLSFFYTSNEVMIIKGWQLHHVSIDANNTILEEYWESLRDTFIYTMENGRAKHCQSGSYGSTDYKYEETTGNLIAATNNYKTILFTWQEGDILSRKEEWPGEDLEYMPESELNNANIDLIPLFSTLISGCPEDITLGFWAGIMGNRCRHLISDKKDAEPLIVERENGYITQVIGKNRHMAITYQ